MINPNSVFKIDGYVNLPKPKNLRNPLQIADKIPRGTKGYKGETTSLCLELIAFCIRNPYKFVEIVDHEASEENNKRMYDIVSIMIKKLELQHFVFRSLRKEDKTKFYIAFGNPQ